jgi:hypothetical protein
MGICLCDIINDIKKHLRKRSTSDLTQFCQRLINIIFEIIPGLH